MSIPDTGARAEEGASAIELAQWDAQQALEFASKIDRDARVDSSLATEEAGLSAQRIDAVVPNVRVDIESRRAIEVEAAKIFRTHVVARWSQRYHERGSLFGKEQLASVGMIVGVPEQ
jgi:hypothetical protein